MLESGSDTDEHSLLTPLYREYLRNEPEEGDNQTTLRTRMRKRVQTGLSDIALLNQFARSDDIERIFYDESLNENTEGNQPTADDRDFLQRTNFVCAMHMVALAWRGLRLNGADKDEVYENVIQNGIVWGEAHTKGVDLGNVEIDAPLRTLKTYDDTEEIDPVEKWQRGLSLSGDDWNEITNRLNDELGRNFLGEEINSLIENHLVKDSNQ